MMTYKEFEKQVTKLLRQKIKDNDYIKALSDDMKKYYDDMLEIEEFLGEPQLSAEGYVIGIYFMYPELP